MPDRTIKTILKSGGDRRVQIYQRDDSFFSFEEERLIQPDFGEPCWIPASRSISLCGSPETAEDEAKSRIDWLGRQTKAENAE
jgi:hypothetical protein